MPSQVIQKRRRRRAVPRDGERSGQFIRRMLLSGDYKPDELVVINRKHFPELKTNRKSIYYYWYHLQRDHTPNLMAWPSQRATERRQREQSNAD